MPLKEIILILVIAVVCTAEENLQSKEVVVQTYRQKRLNNFLFDMLLQTPTMCTGCPPRYCDTDPGIILGYCCGCRRAFDILPVFCPPNIFCPAYLNNVCHDYEYMLHCCC
ncbi:uncharacterized protein LOC110116974 [Athalia rosae]|uniref:uncharacterized protein LOC110116974 n=1 Tax=Athalia rosae TaxID=37344 RepID=UPI000A0ED330|nr:uncharacterized protein LOC110116974 [Athalia rosae]